MRLRIARGGGLSATTVAIVGGAVAGGALATKEVLGGGGTVYRGPTRDSSPMSSLDRPLVARGHCNTPERWNWIKYRAPKTTSRFMAATGD
jgi:regulator of RNase E activity RraA